MEPFKNAFSYPKAHLIAEAVKRVHPELVIGTLIPKVFKGRTRELAAGERWEITGRHPLKPVTTRESTASSRS